MVQTRIDRAHGPRPEATRRSALALLFGSIAFRRAAGAPRAERCKAIAGGGRDAKKRAPEFALIDTQGRKVRLSDFRGQPVALNFWATWCEPCRREMPALEAVHRECSRRGFAVIGIAVDEAGWQRVLPFVREHRLTFPVLLADGNVRQDYLRRSTLPQTVFIDRDGFIVARYDAALEKEHLKKIAEAMLR